MKIKWQWFLGGKVMFWVSIIIFMILIFGFIITYIIDPISSLYIKTKYKINPVSIEQTSKDYITNLGITIDKPIKYCFVRYKDKGHKVDPEEILLGTFHEWNGVYYINISVDLYKSSRLEEIVIHETRHLVVEYLKYKKIIDLTKYTEEIARHKNSYYNNLFDNGIYLLKERDKNND